MAHDYQDPIRQVLRLDGFMSWNTFKGLENELKFELVGAHHTAQPHTDDAKAFMWIRERRLAFLKAEVKIDTYRTSAELKAILAHARETGKALVAARKIVNGCGARVLEPLYPDE